MLLCVLDIQKVKYFIVYACDAFEAVEFIYELVLCNVLCLRRVRKGVV